MKYVTMTRPMVDAINQYAASNGSPNLIPISAVGKHAVYDAENRTVRFYLSDSYQEEQAQYLDLGTQRGRPYYDLWCNIDTEEAEGKTLYEHRQDISTRTIKTILGALFATEALSESARTLHGQMQMDDLAPLSLPLAYGCRTMVDDTPDTLADTSHDGILQIDELKNAPVEHIGRAIEHATQRTFQTLDTQNNNTNFHDYSMNAQVTARDVVQILQALDIEKRARVLCYLARGESLNYQPFIPALMQEYSRSGYQELLETITHDVPDWEKNDHLQGINYLLKNTETDLRNRITQSMMEEYPEFYNALRAESARHDEVDSL